MQPDPTFYTSQLLTSPGTEEWIEMLSEARPSVVAAVKNIGGSSADGEVFFQTAVAHSTAYPFENPPEDAVDLLSSLASAHYQSWLLEHGQELPSGTENQPAWLPSDEDLRAFRQRVYAWKRLRQLGPICREKLVDDALDKAACQASYLALLFPNAAGREATMPQWATDALADEAGYNYWLLSQRITDDAPASRLSGNSWIRAAFFVALLLTGAWYVFQYFNQPVSTEKVFKSNFIPPTSLVEDMVSRYDDAPVAQECHAFFEAADEHYRAGNMELAQEPLLLVVIDTAAVACHSDAWFYLGVIRLAIDDPQTAIECFSKIENLEAFGEDLYWYQGLAFVRLAVGDPSRRELAKRAVERALANSTHPERKQQAAEMLKDLSD